jgi:uncharacterized repeat protein (TIGR01451 family)
VGTPQNFTVTATDVAGNVFTFQVPYTVVGSSELAVLNLASLTVNTGSNLTYNIALLNLGPSVANNVTLTDVLPANTTPVSASFGTVSCNGAGCTDVKTLPNTCTLGSTVTCAIPSVPLLRNFSGVLVKITVKVNAPAGTTLKDTAKAVPVNVDPIQQDNQSTASTLVCPATGCGRR